MRNKVSVGDLLYIRDDHYVISDHLNSWICKKSGRLHVLTDRIESITTCLVLTVDLNQRPKLILLGIRIEELAAVELRGLSSEYSENSNILSEIEVNS